MKCTQCGSDKIIQLNIDARVPRKNASKKVWKNFRKMFVDIHIKNKSEE